MSIYEQLSGGEAAELRTMLFRIEGDCVNQQSLLKTLQAYNEMMIASNMSERVGLKGLAEAFVGSWNVLRKNFDLSSFAYELYWKVYQINRDCFLGQLTQSETNRILEDRMIA